MATLKELMGDKTRGDGRKFSILEWDTICWFEPIYRAHDRWYGLMYDVRPNSFYDFEDCWKEWTPPKQTKKVKLYSALVKRDDGCYYILGNHYSDKSIFDRIKDEIVGWHEVEVEVDE